MKKILFIILAIKHQLKSPNWFRNIFITGNAFGIFRKSSCYDFYRNTPKVKYNTEATARKVQKELNEKKGRSLKCYRCVYCGKYHLGHNRK